MREIVLDTETTGLDPVRGDRLVERDFQPHADRPEFHRHLNPQRDMPAEAFAVYGLSSETAAAALKLFTDRQRQRLSEWRSGVENIRWYRSTPLA
jgi:DNA polymerase III epsilon subunit-like protein